MITLFQRLKERKLVQWGLAYLAVAWVGLEGFGFVAEILSWSPFLVRAAIVVAGAGFLATLVLAWYHGEKGRQRIGAMELALLAIICLGVGVGTFLVRADSPTAQRPGGFLPAEASAPQGSIAVLPFENLSPASEDEYFSDGLTEELINTLARVAGLHVTARSSAFVFKGERRDLREIGRILNVRTVLEGSVRREGPSLRVTAQLVNVEDGFNLWSESYERQVGSIFAIQDEIAGAIVDTLRVRLAPTSRDRLEVARTDNLEAYNSYLLGRFHRNKLSAPGLQQAAEAFGRSIELAPEYAPARAGLAGVYSMMGYFGGLAPKLAYPVASEEAERALALDPLNAEAYLVRAMKRFLYDWDWAAAEALG
jgi:TolB-like protein